MNSTTSFNQKVYNLCRTIPSGKVTTYKAIATALRTKAYRAVGNALKKNPYSFKNNGDVPCHRVVNNDGNVGGFAFGKEEKIKMLKTEGIGIKKRKIVHFEDHIMTF